MKKCSWAEIIFVSPPSTFARPMLDQVLFLGFFLGRPPMEMNFWSPFNGLNQLIEPAVAVAVARGGEMRTMQWAARRNHLGGIPRKMIFMAVGAFAKAVVNLLNNTNVYNLETLLRLVRHRPPGVPLITVSNHMSTLDDPLMWGVKNFPITDANLGRWVLAAEDICFRSPLLSYLFRLGKCIPIRRGGGVYQEHMNEALQRVTDGDWVHTFPEGKVCQEDEPIRRLKWGTASLIARAPVTPIVLPIAHHGFEKVMPEKYMFGKRRFFPLTGKDISIIIGEPIVFDVPKMKQTAVEMSRNSLCPCRGWPSTICGLDEAARMCLYTTISDQLRGTMEKLCNAAKSCVKMN